MTFALLVLLGATDPATGLSMSAPPATPCVYRPEASLAESCPPNHALEESPDPPWLYASDLTAQSTVAVSTMKVLGVSRATRREIEDLTERVAHGNPRELIKVGGLPVVRFTAPPPGPGWAPQEVAFLPVKNTAYLVQVSTKGESAKPLMEATLRSLTVPRDVVDAASDFYFDPSDRSGRNIGTGIGLAFGLGAVALLLRWAARQKQDK
ncbi:MAG: hypothetical protein QM723_34875 [Myxococcaceae bacterium]